MHGVGPHRMSGGAKWSARERERFSFQRTSNTVFPGPAAHTYSIHYVRFKYILVILLLDILLVWRICGKVNWRVPSHNTVLQLVDIDLHIILLILFVAKCPYILKKKYTVHLCEGDKVTYFLQRGEYPAWLFSFLLLLKYLFTVCWCIVELIFERVGIYFRWL